MCFTLHLTAILIASEGRRSKLIQSDALPTCQYHYKTALINETLSSESCIERKTPNANL